VRLVGYLEKKYIGDHLNHGHSLRPEEHQDSVVCIT